MLILTWWGRCTQDFLRRKVYNRPRTNTLVAIDTALEFPCSVQQPARKERRRRGRFKMTALTYVRVTLPTVMVDCHMSYFEQRK